MSRFALLILTMTSLLLTGGEASGQPPLWVVHGRHTTIYMFGSVHILPPGLDWAPPRLLGALPKARELWFELPIDQSTDVAAADLIRTLGYLPPGDSLSRHLTATEETRLRRVGAKFGLAPETLDAMQPWWAEVTLSLKVDDVEGATASHGVEQQLQGFAPVSARRRAFETPAEQIGFLAGASMADQIASLDETLREIEEDPGSYKRMLDGWMTGNVQELTTDALDPLKTASPALYKRLITDRNRRWAETIRKGLAGRGTMVVVVGMAHLIGPEGGPAQLRAAGLAVEGP